MAVLSCRPDERGPRIALPEGSLPSPIDDSGKGRLEKRHVRGGTGYCRPGNLGPQGHGRPLKPAPSGRVKFDSNAPRAVHPGDLS